MNSPISVVIAAVAVFVFSSIWYTALAPVEARVLGPSAPDRGDRPSPPKVLVELARRLLLGAVIAGVARACYLQTVSSTLLLGLGLWAGFPVVLLTGSMMWEKVPIVTALLHAGDWLLKLALISVIVGLWL